MTAKPPHIGLNNSEIFVTVCMKNERTVIPKSYAATTDEDSMSSYTAFVGLVQRMWSIDPSSRPIFDDIYDELGTIFSM